MARLSFIIPTRDRPDELRQTLSRLGGYPRGWLGPRPEVVVIDNGSTPAAGRGMGRQLDNGITVEFVRLEENLGAAARNVGATWATGDWLVMLDDDSCPSTGDVAGVLDAMPPEVGAAGGEILLSEGRREAGGLPEVIIGCGCAIRREVYLSMGGYDRTFGYYVEEYDLCARLILHDWRVTHTRAMSFEHRKVSDGRDFGEILFRLVRNNAWVIARYAPESRREEAMGAMLARYEMIARRENVEGAFERARHGAAETVPMQRCTPLDEAQWRRFTGAAAVSRHLVATLRDDGVEQVRLVAPGKGEDVIRGELLSAGIGIDAGAPTAVIGTLSPGPMLDASERFPAARRPWSFRAEGILAGR